MKFSKRENKRDMVRLYDLDAKQITTIPAAELAPGMVCITLTGKTGKFWADASKINHGPHRHPPFSEEVKDILRIIQYALQEVYPLSLEEWEDGFRCDTDAEREISFWVNLSLTYLQETEDKQLPFEYKRDIFRVLVSCLSNPREKALLVTDLQVMSKQEAKELMTAFYGR